MDKRVKTTEHSSGHKEGHQKKEAVASSRPAPEKKEGLFAYFKSPWTEFKKVVWPGRDETVRMTVLTIIFAAISTAFIYVADAIISWLFFDVSLNRKG